MSYFDFLNTDILNIIFSYMDTYDILKLCVACDTHKNFIINKIKLDIETKSGSLHQCFNCNKKCMNIKICVTDPNHKLCDICVSKCNFCSNFIGCNSSEKKNYCCNFTNVTQKSELHNYGPCIKCSCGKVSCSK